MVNKAAQSGAWSRGLRLGKLGFSLTGSYLGYQAQNLLLDRDQRAERQRRFQQQSSRRVREELGSLKGAVMKLGQLLSLQTHLLPETAIAELANLQMSAPGMHPTLARAQFKASLGQDPEVAFREFDPEPFAAASLGQVHRAITRRGELVAVKIQYPAIRAAIQNDLKLLRSAALPGRLTGYLPTAIFDEVERGFLEETDYIHEAHNIEFFAKGLARLHYVTVPNVHWPLTTDRVLTMSFVEGEPVGQFLKHQPAQAVRDRIGDHLVELYQFQLHALKTLHADHHPGNYLFRPDGSIGLIDFGCVKRISFDSSDLVRCCVNRVWRRGDTQARHLLSLVFGPKVLYARARKMLGAFETMMNILYPEGPGAQVIVDFGKENLLKLLSQAMQQAVRDKLTNPEFAFISRAELGLYSLLGSLRSRVNVWEAWRRVESGRAGEAPG